MIYIPNFLICWSPSQPTDIRFAPFTSNQSIMIHKPSYKLPKYTTSASHLVPCLSAVQVTDQPAYWWHIFLSILAHLSTLVRQQQTQTTKPWRKNSCLTPPVITIRKWQYKREGFSTSNNINFLCVSYCSENITEIWYE